MAITANKVPGVRAVAAKAAATKTVVVVASDLLALTLAITPPEEAVVVGDPADATTRRLLAALRTRFRPAAITALRPPADARPRTPARPLDPLFAGRDAVDGQATLYLCRGGTCQPPVSGDDAVSRAGRGA